MRQVRVTLMAVAALWVALAHAQEPSVVLMSSTTEVDCSGPTSMRCKEQQVWRINDNRGKKYANTVVQLDDNTQLTSFLMTVCDANGRELKKIKKGDLQRSEYTSNLASDAYYLFTDYTPPTYPVIVSIDTEERFTGGFTTFPSFVPQADSDVEVKKARYKLSIPSSMKCRIKQLNTDLQVNKYTDGKGQNVYEASISDMPAVRREPYAPVWSEVAPRIYFAPERFEYLGTSGSLASWRDLGRWQWDMLKDRRELPEDAKRKIHAPTDTCTSARSKVATLYHLLAESTRYVSIQLGIGGLRPFPAAYVWKTGFGDCKALSNYMCAMLKEVGIDAHYTIISTTNRSVPTDHPAGSYFNHVVCAVPEHRDTLWLECTNPTLPLGYVHEDIAGHQAVVVAPDGGTLVTLPAYDDSQNRQVSTATIALAADGSATMDLCQQSFMQQYENMLSVARSSQKDQRDVLIQELSIPGIVIREMTVGESKEDYATPHVDVNAKVTTSQYGSVSGQRIFVPVCPLHKGYKTLPAAAQRINDVCIYNGYVDIDTIDIVLPEGYKVEALPMPAELKSEFGSFCSNITQNGNKLTICNSLFMRSGWYDKSKYEELRTFHNAIVALYRQKVVLHSS